MVICHCQCVNDLDIKNAIKDGACTLKDIRDKCKVCKSCANCKQAVMEIIKENKEDK